MNRGLLPFSSRVVAVAVAAVVVVPGLQTATPAAAATPDDTVVTFSGHGWGHGRGLGQYGSLGYAVDQGWDWRRILEHYYGGTRVASDAGNPDWTVRLTAWDGRETLAYSRGGSLSIQGVVAGAKALRVIRTGPGRFDVMTAPGCGGPWTMHAPGVGATELTIRSTSDATADLMPGVCEPGQSRAYRGELVVVDTGSNQQTVNRVRIESYLRGVVPRESPASWGTAGGGKGMNALRAQSVAARSYALGENRAPYARTCDTTTCQVYLGAATLPFGSTTVNSLDAATTDQAVLDTSGTVMRHTDGRVARTEFSSSTGGWSAGGTFPAVQDLGDATASNPNHSWTQSMTEGQLASRLGVPDVVGFAVTQRNGLGAQGGRVLQAVVDTGAGKVTFTGDQLRTRIGLKSTWFSLSGLPQSGNARFVAALYLDLLGRPVDPSGQTHWTAVLDSRRMSHQQVALSIARSYEAVSRTVDQLYQRILDRPADPGGRQSWTDAVMRGARITDVAISLAGSEEAFQRLGGGDVATWVEAMYLRLIGRAADPGGRNTWVVHTQEHGRYSTAGNLLQSYEARSQRVELLYQQMLQRSVDPSGRETWAQFLLSNDDIVLASHLAGSLEYYNRAQVR